MCNLPEAVSSPKTALERPDFRSLGEMCRCSLDQEVRQEAGKAPCFPCSLNLGRAVVLVLLYCKTLCVNPLNRSLLVVWLVSNRTKDENEYCELAFIFCAPRFFLQKPHALSHWCYIWFANVFWG